MIRNRNSSAPKFTIKRLQNDINCVAILDPSAVWGVQDFLPRRNLLGYSEDLSSTYWTKSGLLGFDAGSVSSAATAQRVDGAVVNTALLVEDSSTGGHRLYSQSISLVSGILYKLSFIVKQGSGSRYLRVSLGNTTYIGFIVNFNLSSGTVAAINGSTNNRAASIVSIGNGFYQCTISETCGVSGSDAVYIGMSDGSYNWSYSGDGASSFYLGGIHFTRADTIDQSYQKITDWTTEQYAWAAQKSVPWLRRNALTNTGVLSSLLTTVALATVGAQTIAFSSGNGYAYTAASTTLLPKTGITYNVSVIVSSSDKTSVGLRIAPDVGSAFYSTIPITSTPTKQTLTFTATGNATSYTIGIDNRVAQGGDTLAGTITVSGIQYEVASAATEYQPILSSWDTTYTANAIAAGYPISLWQDAAGTIAVNGDNQAVGKCVNLKSPGTYDAVQATAANQPKWRLDANGKPYIERDLTNDSLPITLPTVLSDAQLGAELVTNPTMDTDASWTKYTVGTGTTPTWANGAYTLNRTDGSNNGRIRQPISFSSGKTYLIEASGLTGSQSVQIRPVSNDLSKASAQYLTATSTVVRSFVYIESADYTDINVIPQTPGDNIVSSISIREVTGTNVVYTAEGNVTLKDSGLILSGSYAPIVPAADYGRIIMAADSRYDVKIIKYLDQKRGRAYSLGPELVTNGGFDSDTWWAKHANVTISGGIATFAAVPTGNGVGKASLVTVGKTYLVTYTVGSVTSGGIYPWMGVVPSWSRTTAGTYYDVVTATNTGFYMFSAGTGSMVIDNISVHEVLL